MKLKVSQDILDYAGNPIIKKGDGQADSNMSLKDCLLLALARGDSEQGKKFDEKDLIARRLLGERIFKESEIDCKAEEIVLLKSLIKGLVSTIGFNPVIAGQVLILLDAAS